MPAVFSDWTVDMLDALPEDGQRYELIDGELFVTPSPGESHQDLVLRLAVLLDGYVRGRGIGKVMISPSDVRRGDFKRNRVQPDVYVIGLENGARPEYPYHLEKVVLAVEVTSPTNPRYDHVTKRDLYMQEGVAEYWIVDPIKRTITRWHSFDAVAEVASDSIQWSPDGASEPFVLDIQQFFRDAYSES